MFSLHTKLYCMFLGPEVRQLRYALGGVVLAALASCGGSGSSDTASVSGFVSKGPITGAVCTLFNSANQAVTTANTVNGAVSFSGQLPAGAYTSSCSGGTYVDEATGQTVTNTTVLRSGVVIGSSGVSAMTVSPLTELVFQRAGGDATRMEAAAQAVAKAFGLPASVNLLTTFPTDVNSQTAANDGPGKYGTLLAAIAQMQKDQGSSLSNVLTTLSGGIGNSGTTTTLNAAVASLLATATANLTDPTKNSNPAVQGFVAATTAAVQTGLNTAADTTPFVNSIVLTAGTPSFITTPVFGQSYQLVASGGNLGAASLVTTNMSCAAPNVSATSISATCIMATSGAQAGVTVRSAGAVVQGRTPSFQWPLGSGSSTPAGPAEGGGPSADGMSFVYTGLPGGNLAALQNFDFDGGVKTLYWQPNLASGGIPDISNTGTDIPLKNMGLDDRIIIKVSSGAIPEPEAGGTYPNVPSPFPVGPSNPAGTMVPVFGAGLRTDQVIASPGQQYNPGNLYEYVRWAQRYNINLVNNPVAAVPADEYTYYNNRPVTGNNLGKFEIKAAYRVPQVSMNSDGSSTTTYYETLDTITLSGFPSFYNLNNVANGFFQVLFPRTDIVFVQGDPGNSALVSAGCQVGSLVTTVARTWFCPLKDGAGNNRFPGPGGDGYYPVYDIQSNFITFRP